MEYVILHDEIDKYYIDLLIRWENIQNKIAEYGAFDFAAKKNDRYTIAGCKLTVKEIKQLKNIAVGIYPELYMKYPDIVINNSDITVLTEEILEYVANKTLAKWDFLSYFDKISGLDRNDELSRIYEAEAKLRYLKLFSEQDISMMPDDIYEKLKGIALYSKYEDIPVFEKVFSDERFNIPEKFRNIYSKELDLSDKIKYFNDKDYILNAFTENKIMLGEFLANEHYYTDVIIEVLKELNPNIYTIEPVIAIKTFDQIIAERKENGISTEFMSCGFIDRERADDAVTSELGVIAETLIKVDFLGAIPDKQLIDKYSEEFSLCCEKITQGINDVPDVFATGESKKILDAIQKVLKCENAGKLAIEYLNKIIGAFDNGKYNKNVLADIFSQWVETYSIEFKKCIKNISKENIEFMTKYLSDKEIEFLKQNMN